MAKVFEKPHALSDVTLALLPGLYARDYSPSRRGGD